jgi:hypothetical protein
MSGHGTAKPRLAAVVARWVVLAGVASVLPMGAGALAAPASGLAAGHLSRMLGRAAGVAARGQVDRPAVPGSLGATIASIAEGQEGVEDKPSDTYCNPYSAYRGSGTACSNGLRANRMVRGLRDLGLAAGRRALHLRFGHWRHQCRGQELLQLGERARHLARRRLRIRAAARWRGGPRQFRR